MLLNLATSMNNMKVDQHSNNVITDMFAKNVFQLGQAWKLIMQAFYFLILLPDTTLPSAGMRVPFAQFFRTTFVENSVFQWCFLLKAGWCSLDLSQWHMTSQFRDPSSASMEVQVIHAFSRWLLVFVLDSPSELSNTNNNSHMLKRKNLRQRCKQKQNEILLGIIHIKQKNKIKLEGKNRLYIIWTKHGNKH